VCRPASRDEPAQHPGAGQCTGRKRHTALLFFTRESVRGACAMAMWPGRAPDPVRIVDCLKGVCSWCPGIPRKNIPREMSDVRVPPASACPTRPDSGQSLHRHAGPLGRHAAVAKRGRGGPREAGAGQGRSACAVLPRPDSGQALRLRRVGHPKDSKIRAGEDKSPARKAGLCA